MRRIEELLELAARLALRAGEAIMGLRAAGVTVARKGDQSPVTAADLAAEAIIAEGLEATGIPVVAEEAVAEGRAPQPGAAGRFWLVDPLDGTKEFAAGLPEFAVCIGLIEDGRPLLGALALPATGELFAALVPARLAWKEQAGARRTIAVRTAPTEGLTVLDSRSHSRPEAVSALLAGRRIARILPMGSAMKFARLAEGEADAVPRPGPTMEWDTAAGQAIVEAAGGVVLDLSGSPLAYGKPGWRNAGFIAWGAGGAA
ncbi:MAG: 3'(2'),5'-bisphosphate nucleotidase CysQ [Rhodovarius sp.]|nr:3'(2'),5'-bisphosphate nucleotidase CysQ [Rhodovarius sp.]